EAGEDDRWIWTRVPAGVYFVLRSNRGLWRFYTEPEPNMNGRKVFWPRGRVLGGSSTVNGMIWVHGDPAEYDRWRDALGLQGWGADDLRPLFHSIERYDEGETGARGKQGPVRVTEFSPRLPLMDAFVTACVAEGVPHTPDYNASGYEGVGY